ncbi:MAG TPA: nucleotidyltransferase [Myxococcaceae bacterium]|jgi:hypothetical protein
MRNVKDALEQLVQSVELKPTEQERVTKQYQEMQKQLRERLGPQTDFLSGSYSRNTSIRPLHDIDIFVVMGAAGVAPPLTMDSLMGQSRRGTTPDEALKQVRQALKEAWPNKDLPILQAHSVHTEFSGSGIAFDVVPAFEFPGGKGYLIPERESGQWIHTNPKVHEALSTQANERSGKYLKPLLKLVKLWKSRHAAGLLRSFHLEVMSYDAFASKPDGYLQGLEILFSHLAQRVMRPCPDPAKLGPDIDGRMSDTQREEARKRLESASRQVSLAIKEQNSAPAQAHARLRELFGEGYPESGS